MVAEGLAAISYVSFVSLRTLLRLANTFSMFERGLRLSRFSSLRPRIVVVHRAISLTPPTPKRELSPLLTSILSGIVALMVPTLVYYAGWLFLTSYLSPFGIQSSELGLSPWQIASFSLTGLGLSLPSSDTVLDLFWLMLIAAAAACFLVQPENDELARAIRILGVVFSVSALLSFAHQVTVLATSGKNAADQVLAGDGLLYVPIAMANADEKGIALHASEALDSCLLGQRLKPIFLSGSRAWAYCRSASAFAKGYVFAFDDEGDLLSMRRLDVRQ
jgi:hypothetical protein